MAVKKLPEIRDAFLGLEWEEADKTTADYRLLERLHKEGYHPIQVGRSTFVIEQCEDGDSVPHLGATDALRITVYGDRDLHDQESIYYIWAVATESPLEGYTSLTAPRSARRPSTGTSW